MITTKLHVLDEVLNTYIRRGYPVVFDCETTSLNPHSNRMVAMQFQQLGYAPFIFDMREWNIRPVFRPTCLQRFFDGSLLVIGYNLKFDIQQIRVHCDIEMQRVYDVMLAEQILDGGYSENRHWGLGYVAGDYGIEMSKEERKWFFDLDKRTDEWNAPFPAEEITYMEKDVEVLEPIYFAQVQKLKQRKLFPVAKLEFQTVRVLADMELNGVRVDAAKWREFMKRKEAEAYDLEGQVKRVFGPAILKQRIARFDAAREEYDVWMERKQCEENRLRAAFANQSAGKWGEFKAAGMKRWREQNPNPGRPKYDGTVNVGSHDQMMEAFEALHIPARSFREEDLKTLEDDYPAIKVLITYKKKQKLIDAFGEKLLQMIDPVTGRIHTNFRQIIDTGRMASSHPNVQQIPSKGLDGKELRSLFIADPGHKLVINDYAGIEDRILTFLSGDVQKRRIFDEGLDSHTETARMLFGIKDDSIVRVPQTSFNGKSYRDVAKELNYGLMYGLSPFRLAKKLGITTEKAEEVHERYFEVYAGVRDYLAKSREDGIRELVSRTVLGRPRYYSLPEKPTWPCDNYREKLRDYNRAVGRVGRQAANAIIQGTSADITKRALVLAYERLPPTSKILLAVHDEIVIQAPDEQAEDAAQILVQAMNDAAHEYLPGFPLGDSEAVISDHWEKG